MRAFFMTLFAIQLITASDDIVKYPWLEQVVRQETLNSNCHSTTQTVNVSNLDHILVDHNHKLLYCYVPKVACTNWKRVLMVLTGQWNVTNLVEIPSNLVHMENSTTKVSDLDLETAKTSLNTYTTFLMVRHPFERILSAYRNKFVGNSTSSLYFQKRYGRYIIKKYRENPKTEDLKSGANVTFREFIKYLLNNGVLTNEHWAPIYHLCYPCTVNYTFIAHYETLDQDSRTILDMIDAPPIVFPATRIEHTSYMLRDYFQELSILEIRHLYKLYEHDFRLFGYDLEQLLGYDLA